MDSFIQMIKPLPEEHQKSIINKRINRLEKINDNYNLYMSFILIQMKSKKRTLEQKLIIHNNLLSLRQMKHKINNSLSILYEYYSQLYEQDEFENEEEYCCSNSINGEMFSYDKAEYWSDF